MRGPGRTTTGAGSRGATREAWRGRIGGRDVLAVFAVWVALQLLGGLVVRLLPGHNVGTPATGASLALVAAVIAVLGVLIVAARRRTLRSVGLLRTPIRWLVIGLGVGLLARLLVGVVGGVYVLLTGDGSSPQPWFVSLVEGGAWQFALLALVAGLVAPFGEELLFRGFLYTWLRRWGVTVAVLASALAFGLAHGAFEAFRGPNVVLLMLTTTILGVLNALVRERSGSLVPGMAAHAAYNVLALVVARLLLGPGAP